MMELGSMLQFISVIRMVCLVSALVVPSAHAFADEITTNPKVVVQKPEEAIQEPVTVQTIADAWKLTESKVHSAIFEWDETRVCPERHLADDESMAEPFASQYTVTNRLSFQDNKLRHTFKKSLWTAESPANGDQYVGVFNGKDSKVYLPPGYVSEYPRGHLDTRPQSEELESAFLKPLLWTFRPSLPRVALFPIGEAKLLPAKKVVEDRECFVLEFSEHPSQLHIVYVDPTQNFSILRHRMEMDGRMKFQIDIEYQRDNAFDILVPKSWSYESFTTAGVQQLSVTAVMHQPYQINPVLALNEFEFVFPVGTWVHAGNNTEYIITADGPNRPVARRERQMPYLELLREPGLSPEATRWFFWCNLLLLMAISAFLLFRWHQWKKVMPH